MRVIMIYHSLFDPLPLAEHTAVHRARQLEGYAQELLGQHDAQGAAT